MPADDTLSSVADTSPAPEGAGTNPTPVQPADTQAPASPPQSGDTSPASPATPAPDDRAALLAVVQDVVKRPEPEISGSEGKVAPDADPSSSPTDPTAPPTPPVADQPEADPSEDDLKALPPRTKRRVETLLKQRGEARAEVEALKPAAAKWQQLDGYLTQHDLAPEDVNLLLGVGAALRRGDFQAFRDGVLPYLELANQALGLALPADLQAKVDAGEMTTEAATELSVTRVNNVRLTGQVTANTQAQQQAQAREQHLRVAGIINTAVTNWEQGVRSRDPDYPKKALTVMRVSQALIAEHGQPTTADAAVQMAQRALDETNRMFAAVMPARPASRPVPAGVNGVNHARPEPKTLMEAALLGLERSHVRH